MAIQNHHNAIYFIALDVPSVPSDSRKAISVASSLAAVCSAGRSDCFKYHSNTTQVLSVWEGWGPVNLTRLRSERRE